MKFTEEQISYALGQRETGTTVAETVDRSASTKPRFRIGNQEGRAHEVSEVGKVRGLWEETDACATDV